MYSRCFVYYENWLDDEVLTEKFNIDSQRIIVKYNSFFIIDLHEEVEELLRSNGIIVQPAPDNKKLLLERSDKYINKFEMDTELEVDTEFEVNSEQKTSTKSDKNDAKVWIVQFIGPIKEEWVDALGKKGVQLYGYIAPYSLYAYMKPELVKKIKKKSYIEWIGIYNKKYKVHPKCDKDTKDIVVHYFPWASERYGTQECCEHNCTDTNECCVSTIIDSENVMYVEPFIKRVLYNAESRKILKTDIAHTKGITGQNEIIVVTDTGVYKSHEVFSKSDKIVKVIDIAGDSSKSQGDGDGHGTHVACSICGDAPPYEQWNKHDGQCFGSKLIAVKVFDNNGFWAAGDTEYSFWKQGYDAGAKINNNSWGSNSRGGYSSSDYDADKICFDYPDYVLVVAAGNTGPTSLSIGSPAVAKNVISVGSCETEGPENVSSFSSRGPTKDNRIKPDVLSPGSPIISAELGTISNYIGLQGTSMASPQIAGVVSLIRQYFKEGKYHGISGSYNPSSALVKAMIINGAVEVTGVDADRQNERRFPNNSQGWGRVDASRTLSFDANDRRVLIWDTPSAPSTGNKWITSFTVDSQIKQVKITLVWTDVPATVGASNTLVNNLNLRVITPDNKNFLGNNFTGINPSYSVSGGYFDTKNNVEGVHLLSGYSFGSGNPIPSGQYTIEVISTNTTLVNRGFAVVVGIDKIIEAEPTPDKKVAVMGDYNNQLQDLLKTAGWTVDSYQSDGYSLVINNINEYKSIILNRVNNTIGFDNLLNAVNSRTNIGIVFLGSYPVNSHGIGILSNRTKDPTPVDQKWGDGTVKLRILNEHPIFGQSQASDIITIINGGDNDYQTYGTLTKGQNIGGNSMPRGLSNMLGIYEQNSTVRYVIVGSLGISNYTNMTHWTNQGKSVFLNSVVWASFL